MLAVVAAEGFIVRDEGSGGMTSLWRLYATACDLPADCLRTEGLTHRGRPGAAAAYGPVVAGRGKRCHRAPHGYA